MPEKQMTIKDAAALVKHRVDVEGKDGKPVLDKDGKTKTELRAFAEDEVRSCKDYGSHVVIVTHDGQKFSSVDS